MTLEIEKLIKDLNLDVIVSGDRNKKITTSDINRPGLQFSGYYDYFGEDRVQVIGMAEWSYLDKMDPDLRYKRIKEFFKFDITCVIISRGLNPHEEIIDTAKEHNIWVLRSSLQTTRLMKELITYMEKELAETTSLHGELVDVYGVGILIQGKSGIGKSETALELIKRGHILVSDDAVEIKCVGGSLYGTSPYSTSGMIEVRGLGIIDVTALYGLSSVLKEKIIDFVIELEPWNNEYDDFDRLGNSNETVEILGVSIKKVRIPIRPGRNLAVIIEAAAANYRYLTTSSISPVEIIDKRIEEINQKKV
ncbi:Hpr(Ser) kinase/phosphatase [Caloramator quimbayensis]|uniref:HPr kinase/phosphorylase n=1 Tax=Caloramator quimbayensis TaxID=1147123 RepID=A0A1T4YGK5_9CLOT|nr:HPr(Ser) kinase/phosphatase [Caloramator quimbayensis]SKB00957.1 Hpr(Ser) kinase/phosphatase [Caloramator quimbayensis]